MFLGLCILAGMVFMGIMIPKAVNDFRGYERIVSVKGLCEQEVNADKVIWPLVIKVSGDNIETVYANLDSKIKAVTKFLNDGGISSESISVGAASISDKTTEEYNNNRLYRFLAKNVITVCTSDVDKVRELMSKQNELIKKGLTFESDWDSQPVFSFESLNDIKPQMIEQATKNAREVAQKFAQDSESKLGKIKDASQGTFSISDRDSNTPWVKNVRVVTYVTYYLKK